MHARWKRDGVLADITDLLRARVRRAAVRDPEPSAVIMDSQSVRESAEGVVPAATSRYDGSKMVNGRKRHLLTDTMGLIIAVAATAANVPGRLGAAIVLRRARRLALAWGDRGYEGEDWMAWARRETGITIEVVYRDPAASGTFTVLPRRWVIERTMVTWWPSRLLLTG